MRLLTVLLSVLVVLLLVTAPAQAAPKLGCEVTPASAPQGSTFTLDVTGANGTWVEVTWYIAGWSHTHSFTKADIPRSGKFTMTHGSPFSGDGWVIVYSYGWSSYTTAVCFFEVT